MKGNRPGEKQGAKATGRKVRCCAGGDSRPFAGLFKRASLPDGVKTRAFRTVLLLKRFKLSEAHPASPGLVAVHPGGVCGY